MAHGAHCVVYTPRAAGIDGTCRLLAAGSNIVELVAAVNAGGPSWTASNGIAVQLACPTPKPGHRV